MAAKRPAAPPETIRHHARLLLNESVDQLTSKARLRAVQLGKQNEGLDVEAVYVGLLFELNCLAASALHPEGLHAVDAYVAAATARGSTVMRAHERLGRFMGLARSGVTFAFGRPRRPR